jgi:uncharacterized protein YciI
MKRVLATALAVLALCGAAFAQEAQKKERKQFIYVLKLTPRLLDEKNWTEQDNQIVGRHFRRLQRLHKEGRVLMAGRTLNSDPSQFGVVVFEAASEEEARALMEADDAVKEKIMTAQLFPFRVALIK